MAFHSDLTVMVYPRASVNNTVFSDAGTRLNNCASQDLRALGQYYL
jgi:hypothetical protein